MFFEKMPSVTEIVPLGGCSGCSNNGQQVYSGHYTNQSKENAGRCSPIT